MTPTITDDDQGTITATVDGKVVRSWTYSDPNDQGLIAYAIANDQDISMAKAREYAEGWHDCAAHLGLDRDDLLHVHRALGHFSYSRPSRSREDLTRQLLLRSKIAEAIRQTPKPTTEESP